VLVPRYKLSIPRKYTGEKPSYGYRVPKKFPIWRTLPFCVRFGPLGDLLVHVPGAVCHSLGRRPFRPELRQRQDVRGTPGRFFVHFFREIFPGISRENAVSKQSPSENIKKNSTKNFQISRQFSGVSLRVYSLR
jgi:hypothetical protein